MKKMLIIAALFACALGADAFAEESNYTLTTSTAATPPSGYNAAGSIPLRNSWKGIGVGVYDYRDGGTSDNELLTSQIRVRAWIFNASYLSPDAGQGWIRWPQLDGEGVVDAGAGGVLGQFIEIAPPVAGGLSTTDAGLYYTVENAIMDDGGTPVLRVKLITLY